MIERHADLFAWPLSPQRTRSRLLSSTDVLYPFGMVSRDTKGLSLHQAHDLGLVIRVTCNLCRGVRHYDPEDLRHLLGDREIDSLRRRLKCETCEKRDFVEVEGKHLYPHETHGLVIRRLKAIRILRRPVWEDVRL